MPLSQRRLTPAWAALGQVFEASRSREAIHPLYLTLVKPPVPCPVLSSPTSNTRTYWRGPSEGPWRWWRAWNISFMRRGWGSWDCSLEKRRFRGDLENVYKYLKGGYREGRTGLCSARTRRNRHKFKHRRFPLNTRKWFCAVWVVEPREIVQSSWRSSQVTWTWAWALCSGWPC